MKKQEAIALGFHYTGMSCNNYEREKWENTKKRAQAIRRTYKGADFRVVTESCNSRMGSSTWNSIYGNDIFCKAQYFDEEYEKTYIQESHAKRLENLKKEYEEKVQHEIDEFNRRKSDYEYMLSIKK